MKNDKMSPTVTKHTATQTLLLHLLPGLVQLLIFISLIPLSHLLGFSGMEGYFAGNLGVLTGLAPIQFGILFYATKKTTNTYQISKLIPFQQKSKLSEYILFILVILVWALCVDGLISPLENGLRDTLFSFVPDSLALRSFDLSSVSRGRLIFAACFAILSNGIIAPVTEELYFRGYLLPRINLSQKSAVLVSSVLFSLYHFFSPWYFFSRLLMTLPIYYWVMKRKNIRFSILAHLIANIVTGISFLLSVL